MVKKYVEITIASDDANPGSLEAFQRTKQDAEEWSEPSPTLNYEPTFFIGLPWLKVKIEKQEES